MEVGTKVGARRWPYNAAHPDCWVRPHAGVVLSQRDPRAWQGTMAFGERLPTQAEVDRHVDWIEKNIPDRKATLPVLWDFFGEPCAYWESAASVKPYAEDLADWTQALWLAQQPLRKAA